MVKFFYFLKALQLIANVGFLVMTVVPIMMLTKMHLTAMSYEQRQEWISHASKIEVEHYLGDSESAIVGLENALSLLAHKGLWLAATNLIFISIDFWIFLICRKSQKTSQADPLPDSG